MIKQKFTRGFLATGLALYLCGNSYILSYADWRQADNGGWWYKTDDSIGYYTGWKNINGQWYYFDKNGWMQTCWLSDGGDWYYLSPDGSMKSNCWIDGYYLSDSGKMVSGQMTFTDFSDYEQSYLYTMAGLGVDYHFADASYLTDTERIDMVVETAEFTYWDRLGGLDILPAEFEDGYMWAEENAVHTISYYLTGKIPDYRSYNNSTADAVEKFGSRYRFWPANGMGRKKSISILHVTANQDQYIIDYAHDSWEWLGGDDLSIDYSQRLYGTIEVKRSGNDSYPFTFVASR